MRPVTLLGMSGAGKTHFSQRLEEWGWAHYSCDLEIAKMLGIPVSAGDLSKLSAFVGQVGDEALGGLALDEFKRRQQAYYEAECKALGRLGDVLAQAAGRFVNDSTGSFCEIRDEDLIARVAEQTLLVYIETDEDSHAEVIERAKQYPKPLYFPPDDFDVWLAEYCAVNDVSVQQIEPNDFSAWVFPKLFESRLPKYERLARGYGMKVRAQDLHGVENEQEFLALIHG